MSPARTAARTRQPQNALRRAASAESSSCEIQTRICSSRLLWGGIMMIVEILYEREWLENGAVLV